MSTQPGDIHRHHMQALRGVLVLNSDAQPVFTAGIASGREFASRIVAGWHIARRQNRRLFPIENLGTGSCVVVIALPSPDATVLVALQRESRDPLFEFASSVDFAAEILTHFLTNPFEALSVVDRDGILRYLSPVHERFFGLKAGEGIGSHVTQVIENTRLHQVAQTGKPEVGLPQQMRGVIRVVTRHPIRGPGGAVVGAIGQVMFKDPEQLQAMSADMSRLRSEVAYYRRELKYLRNRTYGLDQIVGRSQAIQHLKQQIIKVAPLDVPVLLTGESGTGKELAAHAIHKLSSRREQSIVMVNAAALPAPLVESELFGYEAGAFTGAERKGRKGKVEEADGGSLFFDEIGDMPADVQVKLLRVLQDGTFQRIGSNEPRHSDFRLISASNRAFEAMIANGTFRLDLFYRIGGVTIRLPSLQERLDDVPLLADVALRDFSERNRLKARHLSAEAVAYLQSLRWPGNVRQLMHTIRQAAIFCEGDLIEPSDFDTEHETRRQAPATLTSDPGETFTPVGDTASPKADPRISKAVDQVEEKMITQAMERFNGNKKRVAEELGISRSYLYKKLARIRAHS